MSKTLQKSICPCGICRNDNNGFFLEETIRIMGKYDIMEKNQCGFCKGKSCPTEFLGFRGGVRRHMDKRDPAEVILALQRLLTHKPRSKVCESTWGLNIHFENSAKNC